jgi:hypothetical protein
MAATRDRIGHFGRAISAPKRFRTARNGSKRAETARKRTPSLPGVGNEFRLEPCDLRAIVRTPEAPPRTGRRRAVRTGADGPRQHHAANPIKDQTKVLPAAAAGGTLKVLISPPRDHRKGFSWVPSLRSAPASVRASVPPGRTDAAALPSSCTRHRCARRRAVAVIARASRASSMTTVVDPPPRHARTQRLAVFFSRFLRMRTDGHPVGERQSPYRTTGIGHRVSAATGPQWAYRAHSAARGHRRERTRTASRRHLPHAP